jgi:hypothetical protein
MVPYSSYKNNKIGFNALKPLLAFYPRSDQQKGIYKFSLSDRDYR